MSPTIFRSRGYRFYSFSREESRVHVHVHHKTGEAKLRLEPAIAVAQNYGLSPARLVVALRLVQEHEDEVRTAWQTHFKGRSK